ncbi:hypothetical protein KPH14_008684 [Odynerus spinipes]|uniref:Uncharacterized protein n=1 Tax=Odynerus spinipes TaxID=1348599 RepID=A0AAD9RIC3_9HYME|nr:hypothetical protein KPH14_008684 [Odynerus spinipes]
MFPKIILFVLIITIFIQEYATFDKICYLPIMTGNVDKEGIKIIFSTKENAGATVPPYKKLNLFEEAGIRIRRFADNNYRSQKNQ